MPRLRLARRMLKVRLEVMLRSEEQSELNSETVPAGTARTTESLRVVLDAALDAVIAMDESGIIREWNLQAEALFGWTRQEAIGRTVADTVVPPRARDHHLRGLRRFRETGDAPILGKRLTLDARDKSGREIPIELRVTALRLPDGLRFIAFINDLTVMRGLEREQRNVVAQIDAQRQLFATILSNAPAGIALISSHDFTIEFANPAFHALSPGRTLQGRPALDAWSEIAHQLEPLYRRALGGETIHLVDERFRMHPPTDGALEDHWFTFTMVPIRREGPAIDAILVVAVETTDQVRARSQVAELASLARQRAAELRGIIDHMADAVFVCDQNGRLTLVNAAGAALIGFDHTRVRDLTLTDLAARELTDHGRERQVHELALSRALRGESVVVRDVIVRRAYDGAERWVRSSAAAIRDDSGAVLGAVEVARDVTDAERLERLKREFVRAAAHELNTPVTVVTGYAQVLARQLQGVPASSREMLEGLHRGVERMETIVRALTYVTRIELGELALARERLRFDELVDRVVTRMTRRPVGITVRVARLDAAMIDADRDGIEQTVRNLLSNAIRYSKPGSSVEVSLAVAAAAAAGRSGAAPGGGQDAVLSVRDWGAGIPKERQARIFERFYRAHTDTAYDFEGLGVGLYISHEIVTRLGGRMWFESVEGKGSMFHVAFPIAPSGAA